MRKSIFFIFFCLGIAGVLSGCAEKADPNRSLDRIRKEVETMPLAQLEDHAKAYRDAIQEQRVQIQRIQERIRKMPMQKVFSNNFLQNDIKKVGRRAEALYDRYMLYVDAVKKKGGDPSKVQLQII